MANEWNLSYPIDHTLISDVPGKIRKLKTSAKSQLDHEQETPVDGDATGSEHSSGSAVANEGTSTPTTRPGGATLGDNAIDRGRLWLDDNFDPPVLKRWDGSAWEIPMTLSFGAWTNLDSIGGTLIKAEVYKVGSDGTVIGVPAIANATLTGLTDGSNLPTTVRSNAEHAGGVTRSHINLPVRKDDYWKITATAGAPAIYWLPIGAGTCVKQ